ncbi:hypothetical protein EK904_007223, partial [Melospiza melodia maxima]
HRDPAGSARTPPGPRKRLPELGLPPGCDTAAPGAAGRGGSDVKSLQGCAGGDVPPLMGQLFPSPVEGTGTAEQENLLGAAAANISEAQGLPTKHLGLRSLCRQNIFLPVTKW